MISMYKDGMSPMNENPTVKEFGFDWEAWYHKINSLFNEACNNTNDKLFQYNLSTKIEETRMLLEMKHLIEPEVFELYIPED